MKKFMAFALACSLIFCGGCGGNKKFTAEIYGSFDTVTTVTAFCKNQAEFDEFKKTCENSLMDYSKIYDIYIDYANTNGIYQINANAGKPVKADLRAIELIKFGIDWNEKTDGRVNIAMGSVLKIWHDWRESGGALPNMQELQSAAKHTDINNIIIDDAAQTVMLKDPAMSLDVGAVAKGFAVEKVTNELIALGYKSFVISAGGNVRACGAPQGKKAWNVGIENPIAQTELIATEEITDAAVVTSGGYERFKEFEGKKYHHIISPETLMPAEKIKSATIIYKDSGIADACSTAAFLMEPAQIKAFVAQYEGMQAIIMDNSDEIIRY